MVVLAGTTLNTPRHLRPSSDRLRVLLRSTKTRITAKHRARAVELYLGGMSALAVSEKLGIGKATVLNILRNEEIAIRPVGHKLS